MIKLSVMLVSMLLVAMLLVGCRNSTDDPKKMTKPSEPPLPSAKLGQVKELHVKVADEFIICADDNPSTGFTWFYCSKDDIDGVVLKKDAYKSSSNDPTVCGAPGILSFYFDAVKPGQYELKFENKRPWEKDRPPMTKSIVVIVEE